MKYKNNINVSKGDRSVIQKKWYKNDQSQCYKAMKIVMKVITSLHRSIKHKTLTLTTEGKANQAGISSPARNILRNFVPDNDIMLRFFSLAYSCVT